MNDVDKSLPRLAVSLVVASLFVAACASPAVDYKPPQTRDFGDITPYGVYHGIGALLFGGAAAPLPWSANLLLLSGWVLLLIRMNAAALGVGAAAAVLGLTAWLDGQFELLLGYYLWQSSLIALALGALVLFLRERGAAAPERAEPKPAQ